MNSSNTQKSKYHDFRNEDGTPMTMEQICQETGLSEKTCRDRLREYETPPTDFDSFVARVKASPKKRSPRKEKTNHQDLTTRLQTLQIRELEFKHDLRLGKYTLITDTESQVTILLNTLRDRVASAITNSKSPTEAVDKVTKEFEVAISDFDISKEKDDVL